MTDFRHYLSGVKKQKKRRSWKTRELFLAAVFFFLSPLPLRGEEIALSLNESIALALRENRSILLKAHEIKKAQENIAQARGGFFPSVTALATYSQTKEYFEKDLTQTAAQASVKQYLYTGGKTFNTYHQNQSDFDAAEAALEKTKAEVIFEVKKAFYSLLLTNEFVQLNKQILDNTQQHLVYSEVLYHNGRTDELELLRIKEAFNSVEEAYQESVHQSEALQALLCNLLFIDEKTLIKPEGEFVYDPQILKYEEGVLKALKQRPEMMEFDALEQSDEYAIEISKSGNRPSVYASWDYYARSHLSGSTTGNWNDYSVIGVTMTWPVFDGWATKAKVEEAILDLKQTQLSREKFIKDMAVELKGAYLELKDAINQVKTVQASMAYYDNNYMTAQEKHAKGLLSTLALDDARVSQQVALFNKKQAIYNFIIAKSKFEKATGGE